jgi:hypothetical protein
MENLKMKRKMYIVQVTRIARGVGKETIARADEKVIAID